MNNVKLARVQMTPEMSYTIPLPEGMTLPELLKARGHSEKAIAGIMQLTIQASQKRRAVKPYPNWQKPPADS